jgi:hypothetical protein
MEQPKIKKIIYIVALDCHRSTTTHTTTNQKQAAATEGTMRGGATSRTCGGSVIPSFWGLCKSIEGKKLK